MSGDLLDGLARWFADTGHGTYRPDGDPYRPGEIGIVLDDVVPAPDRLLVLRPYQAGPEPDSRNAWSEPYVQFRCRGGPDRRDSYDRARALWSQLQGASLLLPNGVWLQLAVLVHSDVVPLGKDEAGRHEHAVSARCEYLAPTAHRP